MIRRILFPISKNDSLSLYCCKIMNFHKLNKTNFNFIKLKNFSSSKKSKKSLKDILLSKDKLSIDSNKITTDVDQINNFSNSLTIKSETTTDESDINSILEEINESKLSQENEKKKEKESETPERITTKILCELIGTKHYPVNEEIEMDKSTVVSVYDEHDKLITTMILSDAIERATSLNKEIIIRNAKVKPPIVKMMKYRVELIKRLMKKLGRNLGMELNQSENEATKKLLVFSQKIDKKDFDSKVDKLRQLLVENTYVRVVIPCDIDNISQSAKVISILKNITNEVSELGKVRVGPSKQKGKISDMEEPSDPSIFSPTNEINQHDKIIEEAQETLKNSPPKEKENYFDHIFIEFESLVCDNSGIDYEKLLEGVKFEDIIKGITHTNAIGELSTESKDSKKLITKEKLNEKLSKSIDNLYQIQQMNLPLNKKIEMLEKEVIVQQDYGKRLEAINKIDEMKNNIKVLNSKYTFKIVKNKMMSLTKLSASKAGLLGRELN